ncbi:MAG: hypothetical protein R2873_06770 [Caldilineaceae bacterium]
MNPAAGALQQVVITAAVSAAVCYAYNVTNVVVSPDRYVTGAGDPVLTLPCPTPPTTRSVDARNRVAANLAVTKSVVASPCRRR